jgi:hypothetical protein
MSKQFWRSLTLTLAVTLLTLTTVFANVVTARSNVSFERKMVAQVTTIDELADVSPTDYYYQPLRSLLEDYGCVEGFPDQTMRANRPVTRMELASNLNRCLDSIRFLVASPPRSDTLDTISKILDEFEAEIESMKD